MKKIIFMILIGILFVSCSGLKGEKNGMENSRGGKDTTVISRYPSTTKEVSIPENYNEVLLGYINSERKKVGASPLKLNKKLQEVAILKVDEMSKKNYFSHTSPKYGNISQMLKGQGVKYRTAGENIAKGQKTPKEVFDTWMKSKGHRENLLNPKFKEMGVGVEKKNLNWAQLFIG